MEFIQEFFDFILYLVETIKDMVKTLSGKDDNGFGLDTEL